MVFGMGSRAREQVYGEVKARLAGLKVDLQQRDKTIQVSCDKTIQVSRDKTRPYKTIQVCVVDTRPDRPYRPDSPDKTIQTRQTIQDHTGLVITPSGCRGALSIQGRPSYVGWRGALSCEAPSR